MRQTWRWFGDADKVTLADARQAGSEGIVTALHDLPAGAVWPVERIRDRQRAIAAAGLEWQVVESLDVTEAIKLRSGNWRRDLDSFIASLRNLAACGLRTVAYNLMPAFSWMRTHLHAPLGNGGYTTRFDAIALAAFDLFLLQRPAAEADWTASQRAEAERYLHTLTPPQQQELMSTILQGLPGGHESYSLQGARHALAQYAELDAKALRSNAAEFLQTVCPVAQELGVRLCVHPDDPPRPVLGLPRIVSTEADLDFLMAQVPGPANGITFCTGALGVRADNDLPRMAERFAARIGFAHLRSTERDGKPGELPESFREAAHLEGDADLVAVVAVLVREERRRVAAGGEPIPFRPDHGQELLNDRERNAEPGYPAVGRLRGLAELRGVLRATERWLPAGPLAAQESLA